MKIHINKNGQQLGPFDEVELTDQIARGLISYDDLAWVEGMSEWVPLRKIATPPEPSRSTPPPLPSYASRQQKNAQQDITSDKSRLNPTIPSNANPEKLTVLQKFIFSAIVLATLLILICQIPPAKLGALLFGIRNNSSSLARVQASRNPAVANSHISSIEDAHNYVIGTWTYTGQGYGRAWVRWVFNRDGTMEVYDANPSDDNWGKAVIHKWRPITAKYSDTGVRYYGVEIEGYCKYLPILNNGALRYAISEFDFELTKGDKFPFSK